MRCVRTMSERLVGDIHSDLKHLALPSLPMTKKLLIFSLYSVSLVSHYLQLNEIIFLHYPLFGRSYGDLSGRRAMGRPWCLRHCLLQHVLKNLIWWPHLFSKGMWISCEDIFSRIRGCMIWLSQWILMSIISNFFLATQGWRFIHPIQHPQIARQDKSNQQNKIRVNIQTMSCMTNESSPIFFFQDIYE